jgi:hypothetical protein
MNIKANRSLKHVLVLTLLMLSLVESIRISNDWVRFLKVVNTNDQNIYAKAVFRFSDNVMVYFGCNVYECSYFKSGYGFYMQNQGLCQQRTQLYCEDPTIDKKYLDLIRQAGQVREEFAQVKFYDKSDNFLVAMINI